VRVISMIRRTLKTKSRRKNRHKRKKKRWMIVEVSNTKSTSTKKFKKSYTRRHKILKNQMKR
jgi:hypothetical protein